MVGVWTLGAGRRWNTTYYYCEAKRIHQKENRAKKKNKWKRIINPRQWWCDDVYATAIGDGNNDDHDDQVALPSKGKFTFAVSLKWVRGHKSCTFLWLQSILKFNIQFRELLFSLCARHTLILNVKAPTHGSQSLLFVLWKFGSCHSVTGYSSVDREDLHFD